MNNERGNGEASYDMILAILRLYEVELGSISVSLFGTFMTVHGRWPGIFNFPSSPIEVLSS